MRIAVDAMGGDYAPSEIVQGAVQAAKELDVTVVLVGKKRAIHPYLPRAPKVEVVAAEETIGMDEHPKEAVEKKKKSSIVIASQLVGRGEAEALVTMGSTGAGILAFAQAVPRLPGISRTALAAVVPTQRKPSVILDVGANVRCDAEHLVHFAIMGSLYAKNALRIQDPKVALLSIGEEPTKGGEDAERAYALLKEIPYLRFIGNVEGKDLPRGVVHVIVCKGFVGNVLLKLAEGMAETLVELIKFWFKSNVVAKFGIALLRPKLLELTRSLDFQEHGGAPLLGFRKLCIIGHGRSKAKAVVNAIKMAKVQTEQKLTAEIAEKIAAFNLTLPSESKS